MSKQEKWKPTVVGQPHDTRVDSSMWKYPYLPWVLFTPVDTSKKPYILLNLLSSVEAGAVRIPISTKRAEQIIKHLGLVLDGEPETRPGRENVWKIVLSEPKPKQEEKMATKVRVENKTIIENRPHTIELCGTTMKIIEHSIDYRHDNQPKTISIEINPEAAEAMKDWLSKLYT